MEMPKKRKDLHVRPLITQNASNASEESRASATQAGSEHTSDRDKLLAIFPEEIWELVLNSVMEPTDLENMSIASPFLKNLIHPRKVVYLFPLVWPILAMKYERRSLKDSSYNQVMDDNDPETRVRGYKPPNGTCDCGGAKRVQWFTGILNLRRSCRTWNNAIDAYYQNFPLRTRFPDEPPRSEHMTHEYFVDGIPRSLRFKQHFAKTHVGIDLEKRSPFIGRTIFLNIDFVERNTPKYRQFLNALFVILQTFGRHVLHCEIECSGSAETVSQFYKKLSECLNLMPNLKTLQIMFRPAYFQLQLDLTEEQKSQLISTIRDRPMNGMTYIESLRIDDFLPVPIFNEIIRCSGNASQFNWNVPMDYLLETISLPHLKQLCIEFSAEADFLNFFGFGKQWKLESLNLRFASEVFLDWADIFGVINRSRWAASLTDLTIKLPSARRQAQRERIVNNSITLNLTGLKRLKLEIEDVSSLDFILPMSETMESLDVSLRWSEFDLAGYMYKLIGIAETNQNTHFVGYLDRPLESNIWTTFKKLKRFDYFGCMDRIVGPTRDTYKWSHSRYDWWKRQKCLQDQR